MVRWLMHNTLPFLLMIVLARWLVRQRFGKRGVVELFMVNAVGDLAAHAAFEQDHPIYAGLGAILLWLAMAAAVAIAFGRSKSVAGWLGYFPEPVEVVNNGTADQKSMRHLRMSMDELESELRKQGISDLNQVRSARVEPDGAVVVVRKESDAENLRRIAEELAALRAEVAKLRPGT